MKKRIPLLILSIFLTCNVFCQTDSPKFILASKLYTHETQGLVVRFDKGIDSIFFPIDTTLIKVNIKKLDIRGEKTGSKKVYYQYSFTAKVDTTYILPSAQLWSNLESYEIPLNENVRLKKVPKPTKISKTNSRKSAGKRKFEDNIEPRISKNINKRAVLLWTDKSILQVNDRFKIVIESNKEFDQISISFEDIKKLSRKFSIEFSAITTITENGFEHHYRYFICKALEAGRVSLAPLEISTDTGNVKTNSWSFEIMD